MKARRLKRLRIKRVDLVERGANQEADVVLFKADVAHRCHKCNEEMKADMTVCPKCGAEMKKAAHAAKEKHMEEQVQKLQKDLDAAMALAKEETDKRAAVEKNLKEQGDTIAALKKRLDDADAEIKKARDEAKLAEFKKTVDAFEHLPVQAEVFAPVLKKCNEALDEAGFTELMRVLKAADAAGGGNFSEIGAPGSNTSPRSATAEISAKVAELVAKGMKDAEATTKVMVENPKLAARARRESYATAKAGEEE